MTSIILQQQSMVKDNSIREQMFASIASWLSSELSQKQWCQDKGITYHVFTTGTGSIGMSTRRHLLITLLSG
jgi:hypothetical protein